MSSDAKFVLNYQMNFAEINIYLIIFSCSNQYINLVLYKQGVIFWITEHTTRLQSHL